MYAFLLVVLLLAKIQAFICIIVWSFCSFWSSQLVLDICKSTKWFLFFQNTKHEMLNIPIQKHTMRTKHSLSCASNNFQFPPRLGWFMPKSTPTAYKEASMMQLFRKKMMHICVNLSLLYQPSSSLLLIKQPKPNPKTTQLIPYYRWTKTQYSPYLSVPVHSLSCRSNIFKHPSLHNHVLLLWRWRCTSDRFIYPGCPPFVFYNGEFM